MYTHRYHFPPHCCCFPFRGLFRRGYRLHWWFHRVHDVPCLFNDVLCNFWRRRHMNLRVLIDLDFSLLPSDLSVLHPFFEETELEWVENSTSHGSTGIRLPAAHQLQAYSISSVRSRDNTQQWDLFHARLVEGGRVCDYGEKRNLITRKKK